MSEEAEEAARNAAEEKAAEEEAASTCEEAARKAAEEAARKAVEEKAADEDTASTFEEAATKAAEDVTRQATAGVARRITCWADEPAHDSLENENRGFEADAATGAVLAPASQSQSQSQRKAAMRAGVATGAIVIGQRVNTPDGVGTVKRCDVDGYNVQHKGYCFKHLHADVWAVTKRAVA